MKKGKDYTISKLWVVGVIIGLIILSYAWVGTSLAEEKPQYGGTLIFAVASEPPTYDAHRENSFAVLHPISPHYNLLLKFDPEHYPKVEGDLAESWAISGDHKTYTFKIHKGVKFHDGSILTAKDIKATYEKIIFPSAGIVSSRKAFYSMVEKVEAPDDHTVVFRLKWPAASFLGSLASPFNYIYKADILAKNPQWYEKNIMGTGPFKFVDHVAGSHWLAKRNEDYFVKGRPYLDGYRATFIPDTATRVAAIRSGRVHADFRFLGPNHRDDAVSAMGNKIQVQETPQIATHIAIFNCDKKPFDDPRVRRALTLALDRWEGSKVLSRISNIKEVGGLLRPGSEFAMGEEELTHVAGFSRDINASRKEARRLLREAGIPENFSFEVKNRPPANNYQTVAIWFIDQWRQIGLNPNQKLQELGVHFKDLRSGNFGVILNAISGFVDEPDHQLIGFISADKSPLNFGRYKDRFLDGLYEKQSRAMDAQERKKLCTQFQRRVLDEMAYAYPAIWSQRIVLHSAKMKGWRILPSYFLNQDLRDIWLSKD